MPAAAPAGAPDVHAAPPRRVPLLRSGAVLAVATMGANVLGYGLLLVLSRALGPAGYGAVAALLNLVLLGTVPALALQLVAARRIARAGDDAVDPDQLAHRLGRLGLAAGGLLALVTVAASPFVAAALHLDGVAAVVVLGLGLAPATLVFAVQGVLQGAESFGRLALVYLVAAVARFGGGVLAAVGGAGVTGVMAGVSAGAVFAAVVALLVEPRARPWLPAAARQAGLVPEVLGATVTAAGLLLLVNVDVLLARHTLTPVAAGLYAAGAVFAKITYWGPQFLATLLFARMSGHASRRRAVTISVLLTAGLGSFVVLVVLLGGGRLVALVTGPAYAGLGRSVALFAALGTALAVVQVLVYAGLAIGDRRPGLVAWLAVAVAAAVVLTRPQIGVVGLVTTMLTVVVAAAVAALLLVASGPRSPRGQGVPALTPEAAPPGPAGP